jgi:hypothetical protein
MKHTIVCLCLLAVACAANREPVDAPIGNPNTRDMDDPACRRPPCSSGGYDCDASCPRQLVKCDDNVNCRW